ncbi:MAG: hypothetical protein QOF51_1260, partial [Chloroflexota bacterium]|nr:hypothetical protein [Chloroflexota bacterium]
RANTWIMISVEGFRGDVTPADVAALASKVAVRLDAGTPPSNGVSEGPSRPPTAPKPG